MYGLKMVKLKGKMKENHWHEPIKGKIYIYIYI